MFFCTNFNIRRISPALDSSGKHSLAFISYVKCNLLFQKGEAFELDMGNYKQSITLAHLQVKREMQFKCLNLQHFYKFFTTEKFNGTKTAIRTQ